MYLNSVTVFFARSDWLLNLRISSAIHRFTSSSSKQATPNSGQLRAKWPPGLLPKQTKKLLQIIKQAVPEIHEDGEEIRFGSFTR